MPGEETDKKLYDDEEGECVSKLRKLLSGELFSNLIFFLIVLSCFTNIWIKIMFYKGLGMA